MNDLELLQVLANAADEISLSRFRALDLKVETKPDRTPVTDADRAVEAKLRELLKLYRPMTLSLVKSLKTLENRNAIGLSIQLMEPPTTCEESQSGRH